MRIPWVVAMLLCVVGCSEDYECPGLPEAEIPADWGAWPDGFDRGAFDAEVRQHMREGCIPALSLAVVDAEGLLLNAAYGWTNVETEQPVTVETPFMVASTSKAVDGVAALIAESEGLLSPDDNVSDLVGFRVRNERLGDSRTIRLRHLATHTSGIRDNWNELDPTYVPGDFDEPLEAWLRGYLRPGGAQFSRRNNFHTWPAGREWYYSNVGVALAALAIEVQAGEPYQDYCASRVFEPLGMRNTGWFLADFDDPEQVARPHGVTEGGAWDVQEHYGFATWPDGQLRTTAADLGQILRVRLNDGEVDGVRLLPPGMTDAFASSPVRGIRDWVIRPHIDKQNYFWFRMRLRGRTLIGHDGDDDGVTSEMFYDEDTGIGVALIGNIPDGYPGLDTRNHTAAIQDRLYAIGEEYR